MNDDRRSDGSEWSRGYSEGYRDGLKASVTHKRCTCSSGYHATFYEGKAYQIACNDCDGSGWILIQPPYKVNSGGT